MYLLYYLALPDVVALVRRWNIHLCTIRDFVDLVEALGAHIERGIALDHAGAPIRVNAPWWVWNLFGAQAIFLLERDAPKKISSFAAKNT